MLQLKSPAIPPGIITMETAAMATTINTYLKSVKLITAASLSALETAVNTYITGLSGEYATRVDVGTTTTE